MDDKPSNSSDKTVFCDRDEIEFLRNMLAQANDIHVNAMKVILHSIWARTLRYFFKIVAAILIGSSTLAATAEGIRWVVNLGG